MQPRHAEKKTLNNINVNVILQRHSTTDFVFGRKFLWVSSYNQALSSNFTQKLTRNAVASKQELFVEVKLTNFRFLSQHISDTEVNMKMVSNWS